MAQSEHAAHNPYVQGYAKAQIKHHEWRTAENSAAYLLPVLQRKAQDTPSLAFLDVGAGPGTITASLAKYMPRGQIIATDISWEVLQTAAQHAKDAGVTNITFQTADVYNLPFADNTFDIVHASMVLTHLDAPIEALREMLRVTKSEGGVVANRESDLRMWTFYPELPAIVWMHQLLNAVHEKSGASIKTGSELIAYAMKAGVKRGQITMGFGTWTYSSPEEREMWGSCSLLLIAPCDNHADGSGALRRRTCGAM